MIRQALLSAWVALGAWFVFAGGAAPAQEMSPAPEPIAVEVSSEFYNPNSMSSPGTRRMIELMHEDPRIRLRQWGGISLPGGGRSSLLMSIAGQTAPDVTMSWYHLIRNDIKQGFLYPLNEWIGEDTDGNGRVDLNEARWEGWKKIDPHWRDVATVDGKIYGLPVVAKNFEAIVFRSDMVRAAGLDPERPPGTWDQLVYWCQRLTDPKKDVPGAMVREGQRGICMSTAGWRWLQWLAAAGGSAIEQSRISPTTGKAYVFGPKETSFITPEGEDLSHVKPRWRACFGSEAGVAACAFYHRLFWTKWLIDPETHEPVNLSEADLVRGTVAVGARELRFCPEDVIVGMARAGTAMRGVSDADLMGRGEVAMMISTIEDLQSVGARLGLDPDLLSWFPVPAGPGPHGLRAVMKFNHYAVLIEGVGRRPKLERDRVWKVLEAVTDERAQDEYLRRKVIAGMARFVDPRQLKRLGFDDYLKDIPESIQQNYRQLETGEIRIVTEPFTGFWFLMDMALNNEVLSLIGDQKNGESFDYASALKSVETRANSGLMFGYPKEILDRYRPYARAIFALLALGILAVAVLIVKQYSTRPRATQGAVHNTWIPWAMLVPAVLLIALWGYYPMVRGMVMAFQDYKITGGSTFVGLDNFIQLALDRTFWASIGRTIVFVFLNMLLAFTAPIVLAILLSEIPRGKILFRLVFYLPQVTSSMVIALLWKLMYNPTPFGFLNRLVELLDRLPFVHIAPQTWLLDSRLAMICCVIPAVWASMGASSLIYLAALKSVPDENYEAADLDGAGVWIKFRHITIPTIMPLIVINFVGAFIATFQNMGNIFLLTFGGPGQATMVVGLKIWIEAYANLRFGMATTMAWILGSLLISFTYIQLRVLRKVEFRKAQAN